MTPPHPMVALSAAFLRHRLKRRLSMKTAAQNAGIARSTLQRIEHMDPQDDKQGRGRSPRHLEMDRLAASYGLTLKLGKRPQLVEDTP